MDIIARNGPILTLSHCWGTEDFLKLTTDNMATFQDAIPVHELRQVFQDAINVTRSMGQTYLWIDSLCIIQKGDEMQDWSHECLKMSSVYSGSYCNIAATCVHHSEKGLFQERFHNIFPPTVDVENIDDDKRFFTSSSYDPLDHLANMWDDEITSSSLLHRAWVFQERILSPRVLHFAKSQLFFECLETQACEDFPGGLSASIKPEWANKYIRNHEVKSLFGPGTICARSWETLVMSYSGSQLSHESDRLAAVSGLASYMANTVDLSKYAAGLWDTSEAEFINQLCWRRTPAIKGSVPDTYQAPSWSWASAPGAVDIPVPSSFRRDTLDYGKRCSTQELCAKVLGWNVKAERSQPTGKVLFGRLCLEAPLFLVRVKPSTIFGDNHYKVGNANAADLIIYEDAIQDGLRLVGTFGIAMLQRLSITVQRDSQSYIDSC